MHSLGINGEGELREQLANPGSLGKWSLKRSVCKNDCLSNASSRVSLRSTNVVKLPIKYRVCQKFPANFDEL